MADATFTLKDEKLFKQVIGATAAAHDLAGMLWTMFAFPLAVMCVAVHKLLLSSNDVHGGLGKNRLHYFIQWYRDFNCYFKTHSDIDAL